MDEVVRRWKPKGRVYFWYEADRRQGEGWHIAADPGGCDDLEQIVSLARAAQHPARFTFASASAGMVGLTISFNGAWSADHWVLTDEPVVLSLGDEGLTALLDAVSDMRKGDGDYCIGPHDQRIWVWWPPKA
ncbi:hypothetical protein [Brevundimonas sp. FT23042]|uniref:hypothetical protein n=1 Tax=Brevundimonas sp. FT23042 TaxID=3393749 RepID=UPI003B589434